MSGNVYRSLRPVLLYSRLVGIYPQSNDRRHRLIFHVYFCLYSSLVIVCSAAALLWLQLKDPEWYKSPIHLVIEKSQVVVVFANYTVALGSALCQYKNFQNVLKGLHDADKALGAIGVRMRYDNSIVFRVLLVRVVAQIGLLGVDLYLSWKNELRYNLFDMVSTYAPLFSVTALQLQAFALLKFIGNRFSVMKSEMEELQVCPNSDKIVGLLRVYDVLKRIALNVNECFSLNTIFSLTSIFFYVIVTLHLVATSGIIRSEITVALYVFGIGFVVLKLYELWTIIEPFVFVPDEVIIFLL